MFPYVIRSQIEQISYVKNITQKAELRTNSSLEKTEVLPLGVKACNNKILSQEIPEFPIQRNMPCKKDTITALAS